MVVMETTPRLVRDCAVGTVSSVTHKCESIGYSLLQWILDFYLRYKLGEDGWMVINSYIIFSSFSVFFT